MKERADAILRPRQAEYLERLLPPRGELVSEMEAHAAAHEVPIADPEVARLLTILAASAGGARLLEIGTGIGYGTLALAKGAPDGEIVTIDHDAGRLATARDFLERGGVLERVELVEGEALEVLAGLDGPFDLVFLDAVKEDYRRYLDLTLPKLQIGGLVVADNCLWKGRVADREQEPEGGDETAEALRSFNGYLMMHPQLVSLVLPLGDGTGVAVKTERTILEMGGPFP